MPFPTKILPVEAAGDVIGPPSIPMTAKSRFKRLFERPFSLRAEKQPADAGEGEPSSVCLAKLVQSFMEDGGGNGGGEKPSTAGKCGKSRCNCFNGNCSESSDDDIVSDSAPFGAELLKNLVTYAGGVESNLLADIVKLVEKNRAGKRREGFRRVIAGGLVACGYDAAVCKSRWDKSFNLPAGEHEYIDVVMAEGKRLVVDIDFKSEFKIARPTKAYRAVLQSLPPIFVGETDRLRQVVALVAEAARRSMKKRGLLLPPWRKPEYMKAKWLAPHSRLSDTSHRSTELKVDLVVASFASNTTAKVEDEKVAVLPVPSPAAT